MKVQIASHAPDHSAAPVFSYAEIASPTYVVSDSGYVVNVDPVLESDDHDDNTSTHVASVLEYIRKKVTHSTVY